METSHRGGTNRRRGVLLESIIENIKDYAIFATDEKGNVSSWNPGAERILGYKADEILGLNAACLFVAEDIERHEPEKELETARTKGRAEDERWHRRRDGGRFWASGVVTPLKDDSGTIYGYAKVMRDLTERKVAHDSLRQSEERYRSLLESITDYAIFTLDSQGNVNSWNSGATNILGYRETEILGKNVALFFTPEDLQNGEPGNEMRTAAAKGRASDDRWHVRKDGTRFWASGSLMPLHDPAGALRGYAKIMRDVTERKQSQEELLDNALQQALVSDLGHKALAGKDILELLNEAAQQVAHVLKTDYCKILELLPGGRDFILRAGYGWREGPVGSVILGAGLDSLGGYAIEVKEPIVMEDIRTETRFSVPAFLMEHDIISGVAAVIMGTEKPYGVIGACTKQHRLFTKSEVVFLQSIANVLAAAIDRKQAEEKIAALNGQLEQKVVERTQELSASNKELESFCYSISHDLRTPLRSIGAFSDLILHEDHQLLPDTKERFGRILAASQRMSQLIDNLLDLSLLTRKEMKRESVDLSALAHSIIDDLEGISPQRHVDVRIAEGLTAWGDSGLLRSVMQNLLHNAWKFTAETPNATIGVGQDLSDQRRPYFVRDNGAGFDMAYVNNLFEPFQRLHTEKIFTGTGIGLAIVHRIVHRHGGRTWAAGEENRGATLFFTVPVKWKSATDD